MVEIDGEGSKIEENVAGKKQRRRMVVAGCGHRDEGGVVKIIF